MWRKNYHVALLLGLVLFSSNNSAEVIHSERSLYRNIEVIDDGDLRCLRFHTKKRTSQQSCFLKSNPQKLVFNYTKLVLSNLLINPSPKRILIIGLGGGTLSNTLHDFLPTATIDNVELDPAVTQVARRYFQYFENNQVSTYHQDGRLFIKRALSKKKQYDLIILDAFNGDYIPEHLMTKEFLTECKNLLSSNGILTANTFSRSALYQYESATYHAVFGVFFNVMNQLGGNRIILVGKQPLSLKLLPQNTKRWLQPFASVDIDAKALASQIKPEQSWPQNAPILTDQYSPVNLLNQ